MLQAEIQPPGSVRFAALPPLALYAHLPWCVRKCPYCDFNSHEKSDALPEREYVDALVADLEAMLPSVWGRRVTSLFIGGGTPSLFSPASIDALLSAIRARIPLEPGAEVTLEANPGTAEAGRFRGYREAGVNRISLGIQSFDDAKLKALGRIHSAHEARRAIEMAQGAFDNVNLDLMYGLPQQTVAQAQAEIAQAARWGTTHLSAYQLSIEPNTVFFSKPPVLPSHDTAADMQLAVEEALGAAGFEHYETSAFARPGRRCRHNLNYWEFGDYLGLGAGAHGKLSFSDRVTRHERPKPPREYMAQAGTLKESVIASRELPFEFMLNALRLVHGVPVERFEERTGLALAAVARKLAAAEEQGLLEGDPRRIRPTRRGRLFLNDLLQFFLP
ncbi:MAG TPA: radical SAM family heme chaperone HemW [Burkholderiales bacterium]|nr:radical SAM family heme chaperone HemW [Burkholderiales bacterium]